MLRVGRGFHELLQGALITTIVKIDATQVLVDQTLLIIIIAFSSLFGCNGIAQSLFICTLFILIYAFTKQGPRVELRFVLLLKVLNQRINTLVCSEGKWLFQECFTIEQAVIGLIFHGQT